MSNSGAVTPVKIEMQPARPTETSPLLGMSPLMGLVHKSTVSPDDLFQRMPLHTFDKQPEESPQDIQPKEKERSILVIILLSTIMILVPFAKATQILVYSWKEKGKMGPIMKISAFLAAIFDILRFIPFFLLIGEDIWSDFFCLLLLYLIFSGISIFGIIIEETHERASKNKRLYRLFETALKRNEHGTDQSILLAIKGALEAENMDIFSSVFNFQVLEGNQKNIKEILEVFYKLYAEPLQIKKHEQQPFEGKELLFMALTNQEDTFHLFFFGSYFVIALRLTAILVPLYHTETYYKLISNHSDTFIGFAITAIVFFYGLMPPFQFFTSLLRENIKDYYGKVKWIAYLINIDIEKEEGFEQKPFKLNIFDENTLETWFITLVLTRRAVTQRISHVEKSTGLFLIYIILFGIFTGACYVLDALDKEYFGYGYLFLLVPIDILTILPPIVIYLYYGLKVNEYRGEISSMLNSLVILYEKMEDAVRDPNATNFEKSRDARYRYLWSCLVKSVNLISEEDSFQSAALQKLTVLKKKVKSIQRRFHEEYDNNPYMFCGLLPCTIATYQVIIISAFSAAWSSIVGFIYQLLD